MPNPRAGETQDEFIARFMESPEARKDFPEQKQRAAVAYSKWRENIGDPIANEDTDEGLKEYLQKSMGQPAKPIANDRGQTGKPYPIEFIEPGLVAYADVGTVLVRKATLDRMNASLVGRPIFNETHREVSNDDYNAGKAQGTCSNDASFNPETGYFRVTGLIWDDETLENVKSGRYSVSCAYDVKKWGPGGVHNNIPYDREVLEGEYTHLAIVDNPRYEGARLIINQGGHMKLKFWQKTSASDPVASEVELANSAVEVDGKETKLEEIIAGYKAQKARELELANSTKKPGLDDVIDLDGQKVAIKDLVAGFKANLKNASEKDDEEKEKERKEKERANAEAKDKEDKEKKEKEDMENRKNEEEHEKGDHKEKPMENCLACKAETSRKNAQHFEDLRNARQRGEGEFREPGIKTAADRIAVGQERYGSPKS